MKNRISFLITLSSVLCFLSILTSCSGRRFDRKWPMKRAHSASPVTDKSLEQSTNGWPKPSLNAINALKSKYGLPSAITSEMVIWENTPPFKQSIVYKEQIKQLFPYPHNDVLQQTISYKVPVDKVSELSKFDGSLIVDRTKGEISTRNDSEEMNFLCFNLADQIAKGLMSAEEARRIYTSNAESYELGNIGPMFTELSFKIPKNTSDPDSVMQSMEPRKKDFPQKKIQKAEEYLD